MQMSQEQEEQFLMNYSDAVWKIVNLFRSGMKNGTSDEDLHQEGMIVLMAHARKAKNEEELRIFPRMEIKNAICRYLMKQEVVNYPKTRTSDYTKVVRATKREPLEAAFCILSEDNEDKWIYSIDMNEYLKTIPEKARDVFMAKLSGEKTTEIAKRLGLTPGAVTHSVQKTLKRFLQERIAA
jgi:RNA polymerase sigma factor (sigma-70 family)